MKTKSYSTIRSLGLIVAALALATSAASGQAMSGSVPNAGNSSLLLWLDASQGVSTDGSGNVTGWVNQSTAAGKVGDAVASGTADVVSPTYLASSALNGQAAIQFSGKSSSLSAVTTNTGLDIQNASALMKGGTYTTFFVMKTSNEFDWDDTYAIINSNYNIIYLSTNRRFSFQENNSADWATLISENWAIGTDKAYVLNTVIGGAGAGESQLLINGTRHDNGTAMPDVTNTASLVNLGYDSTKTNRFFNGLIAEVLIYDSLLSQSEIDGINSYLATKYDIPVVVPEPSVMAFSLIGILGILWMQHSRRNARK